MSKASSPRKRGTSGDDMGSPEISSKRLVQIMSGFFQDDKRRTYDREDDGCDFLRFGFKPLPVEEKKRWIEEADAALRNPKILQEMRLACCSSNPDQIRSGLHMVKRFLGLIYVWSSPEEKRSNAHFLKMIYHGFADTDPATSILDS